MKYFLLVISAFYLMLNFSLAQKYNFRTYSVDEGLPQAAVLSIYSDDEGFLHIGTQGGYSFFDGLTFKTLNQKDGLNSNHVTAIHTSGNSETWLGHRYDAPTQLMGDSVIPLKGGYADSISSTTNAILKVENTVYIGTEENGLFSYRDTVLKPVVLISNNQEIVSVNGMAKGKNNVLLVGTEKGLFYVDNTGFKVVEIPDKLLSSDHIQDVVISEDGSFLIMTNNEIIRIYLNKDQVVEASIVHKKVHRNIGNWLKLLVASNGDYWISSMDGAVHIEKGKEQLFTTKNGLAQNHISALAEDREGNIWLGLFGHGLYQLLGDDFRQVDETLGLVDNTVQAITSYENDIWVGTPSGLTRLIYETSDLLELSDVVTYTQKEGLIDDEVYGLVTDPSGAIWISSMNGVARFDYATQRFDSYPSEKTGLPKFLLSIEIDQQGSVWTCSLNEGCARFSITPNGTIDELETYTSEKGFFSDEIWRVFEDSKGQIWIGSNNKGLLKIDGDEMKLYGASEGLTNSRAGSITEDIYGNIWIGSIGGGVYCYDGKIFKNYTSADGITADNPYFVIADSIGNVWIGSNKGVDRFSVKDESISFFGKNEGFKGIETNQNACHLDAHGQMWFGTIKGVIQCLPGRLMSSETPPKVLIKGIRVFLKDKDLTDDVVLTYDQNYLTFDFIGVHYTAPKAVQYSFKLEGFDEDWSPLSAESAATYSNLPPGDFTFKVKARNRSGVWSEPTTFTVHITPPFWMTWWFMFLTVLTVLLIIYGVFRMRTHRLRKQSSFLKHEVSARTKELLLEKEKVDTFNEKLAEQNDLLAIKNKDITDSIRYAERIQKGMLPGQIEIKSVTPSSFILYRPRDIVSGDFYWAAKQHNRNYFAAIDCTGHGVPGAFMSLIGNDLLNQVAYDPNMLSTGELLTAMHNKLRKYFIKEGSVGINDGMDMALCALVDEQTLEFSGAKRPLFHVRNKSLTTYKGDRYSIGEAVDEVEFETITIDIQKGDMIYIFSDGYQDQFGGTRGKKFMIKKLRNLLIDISDQPVDKQHEILSDTLDDWKGSHEQVDDVLIWGVRF